MLVTATDLTLTYQDSPEVVYAVRDVSLSLPATGLHVFLGPSGSGKTSLLYLLSGIKQPSQGSVLFSGKSLPVSSKEMHGLRRKRMGFVFQMHFLISYLTVMENVLVSVSKVSPAVRKRAGELLDRLGLTGLEHRKPSQLSGGQRQRVAIARAFLHNPDIVFVDEPTASLDHTAGGKVIAMLKEFSKDACVVIVTHDESIIDRADTVHRMRDGRLTTVK